MDLLRADIEQFDVSRGDWQTYSERIDQAFLAHEITDEDKKRAKFLTLIGADCYALLRTLCHPDPPGQKTFVQLRAILDTHFVPSRIEVAERYKLFQRRQSESESMNQYIAVLRKMAEHCNYGTNLDSMLRDAFVFGIRSDNTRRNLLKESNLTLKTALEIACASEAVERDLRSLKGSNMGKPDFSMNSIASNGKGAGGQTHYRGQNHKPTSRGGSSSSGRACWRCGSEQHSAHQCHHINKECSACGKPGHLARVCKSSGSGADMGAYRGYQGGGRGSGRGFGGSNRGSWGGSRGGYGSNRGAMHHRVETHGGSYNEPSILNIRQNQNGKLTAPPPIFVNIDINDQQHTLELDCGAALSVMGESQFRKNFPNLTLTLDAPELFDYNGSVIDVAGVAYVSAAYKGQSYIGMPLVVTKGEKPSCIGRNWLRHITLDWDELLRPLRCHKMAAVEATDPEIQKLLAEYADIFTESDTDPLLRQCIRYARQGWPAKLPAGSESLRPFFSRRSDLSLDSGCLFIGPKLVIPTSLRNQVLDQIHSGHPGMTRMKMFARSRVWWPAVDSQIEALCKQCLGCNQTADRDPDNSRKNTWPQPVEPWERVHLDFAGPINGKSYLILVDAGSNWPEVAYTPSPTTDAVVTVLRSVFAHQGLPRTIVTDNGTPFTSEAFENFCSANGIEHCLTAPYHPSSNGEAERMVATFKKSFAAQLFENSGKDVHQRIQSFLLSYRSTPSVATGKSPAEVLLGRQIRTRVDQLFPLNRPANPGGLAPKKTYHKGEPVWVRNFGSGLKWLPGSIKEMESQWVTVVYARGTTYRRHVSQVRRRVPGSPELPGEEEEEWDCRPRAEAGDPAAQAPQPVPQSPPAPNIPQDQPLDGRRYPDRVRRPIDRMGL